MPKNAVIVVNAVTLTLTFDLDIDTRPSEVPNTTV